MVAVRLNDGESSGEKLATSASLPGFASNFTHNAVLTIQYLLVALFFLLVRCTGIPAVHDGGSLAGKTLRRSVNDGLLINIFGSPDCRYQCRAPY